MCCTAWGQQCHYCLHYTRLSADLPNSDSNQFPVVCTHHVLPAAAISVSERPIKYGCTHIHCCPCFPNVELICTLPCSVLLVQCLCFIASPRLVCLWVPSHVQSGLLRFMVEVTSSSPLSFPPFLTDSNHQALLFFYGAFLSRPSVHVHTRHGRPTEAVCGARLGRCHTNQKIRTPKTPVRTDRRSVLFQFALPHPHNGPLHIALPCLSPCPTKRHTFTGRFPDDPSNSARPLQSPALPPCARTSGSTSSSRVRHPLPSSNLTPFSSRATPPSVATRPTVLSRNRPSRAFTLPASRATRRRSTGKSPRMTQLPYPCEGAR